MRNLANKRFVVIGKPLSPDEAAQIYEIHGKFEVDVPNRPLSTRHVSERIEEEINTFFIIGEGVLKEQDITMFHEIGFVFGDIKNGILRLHNIEGIEKISTVSNVISSRIIMTLAPAGF